MIILVEKEDLKKIKKQKLDIINTKKEATSGPLILKDK